MKMPNKKRMLQIGVSLIVLSIIVFSLSTYFISQSTTTYNKEIAMGGPYGIASLHGVSQGDDLEYSVTPANGTPNITIYWISPAGHTYSNQTLKSGGTTTSVIVAPESGNWTFMVINNGNAALNATISLGDISYSLIYSVVFGFVLLPAGIAFIVLYFYIRRSENKMKKMMERELQ